MGQVSGALRKPGSESSAAFLVDVFIIAVLVFTDTDTLCIPRDQLCVSRGMRQAMLPNALRNETLMIYHYKNRINFNFLIWKLKRILNLKFCNFSVENLRNQSSLWCSRLSVAAPGLTGQLADWCLLLTRRNLPHNIRNGAYNISLNCFQHTIYLFHVCPAGLHPTSIANYIL